MQHHTTLWTLFYHPPRNLVPQQIKYRCPQLVGAQTEGICFFDYGRCYVSAETSPTMTSKVFVVDFRKWIDKELKNKEK